MARYANFSDTTPTPTLTLTATVQGYGREIWEKRVSPVFAAAHAAVDVTSGVASARRKHV